MISVTKTVHPIKNLKKMFSLTKMSSQTSKLFGNIVDKSRICISFTYGHYHWIWCLFILRFSNDILTLSRYASIFFFNLRKKKNYLQINMFEVEMEIMSINSHGFWVIFIEIYNTCTVRECTIHACIWVQLNHPYSYCLFFGMTFIIMESILKAKYLMSTMKNRRFWFVLAVR